MGVLDGQVAFISGGARGQGRSHAIRLAEEGADIITFDICESLDTVVPAGATEADLAETVREVEARGRKIVATKADVRDPAAVQNVLDEGVAALGRVDIVLANAGIMPLIGEPSTRLQAWRDAIDIMLSGVLYTVEAAIPTLIEQGDGGSVIITSSITGMRGMARTLGLKTYGLLGYCASKHGVIGLMRSYAVALGPYNIRCNTIHPMGLNTPMTANPEFEVYATENPELIEAFQSMLPIGTADAIDMSNAVVFLSSEAGRYITGVTLPIDGGAMVR
jgi:SDR family mycofactocin-dependent oxidoreductase